MDKLKGGVLAIGSLLWDTSELREKWRNEYLNIAEIKDVKTPIRYGRMSTKRGAIFTMVFSTECLLDEKIGNGKFIPFKNNPLNFVDLNVQCTELIKAEYKKEKLGFNRYNWAWGTVGIMFNPKVLTENNPKFDSANFFLKEWTKKIGNGFNSNQYKVGNENPILDENAILKFNWPNELNDFDFFVATSNKPEVEKYPTPKEIAKKIIENKNNYFSNNIKYNINTFQDKLIEENLKNETN